MVEMTIEHKSKQAKELQSFRLDIIGNDVKWNGITIKGTKMSTKGRDKSGIEPETSRN
jgi:hypothetical protein